MIAELKIDIVLLRLQVLQEPQVALAELQVALDGPRQAVTHEAEVDEAWTHGDLLGAEGVPIVPSIELLILVQQWGPFDVILFVIDLVGLILWRRYILPTSESSLVKLRLRLSHIN